VAQVGVYPGSFNPPTVAHLTIAEVAVQVHSLDRIDLVVSRRALDKEHVERPRLQDRLAVLEEMASTRPWLGVAVSEHQLLVDIATGYDLLVVGADKYQQLLDVRYYRDEQARDDAVARLPTLAIAPRPPHRAPADLLLPTPEEHHDVSSTRARTGEPSLMVDEARSFDLATGAWTDPARYEAWRNEARG
jgi:hypothetical protein